MLCRFAAVGFFRFVCGAAPTHRARRAPSRGAHQPTRHSTAGRKRVADPTRRAARAPPRPPQKGIYVRPGRDRDTLTAMLQKEGYVPVWLEHELLVGGFGEQFFGRF
jgi:hypothetical protein